MRLQLAINVSDLDEAVQFYAKMFDTEPAKIKPGYANFAIADPPLKLVLFENGDAPGTLNPLGVQPETSGEVVAAEQRLSATGLQTTGVDDTQCCYAEKTETWVTAPDDLRWEYYVKTGDSETLVNVAVDSSTCCSG
jgi:catechol 2,3-dioxygenase-like lactoylglutathione lyase family enzyme